jgi:hypothetical protein
MAASQNVVAAVTSGWLAITAGAAAVAVSFACIPLLDRRRGASLDSKTGGGADGD